MFAAERLLRLRCVCAWISFNQFYGEREEKGTRHCVTNLHKFYATQYILDRPLRSGRHWAKGQRERGTTEESNEFLLFIFSSCICVWGSRSHTQTTDTHMIFLINLMNNWFKKRKGISVRWPTTHVCAISVHIRLRWHLGKKITFSDLFSESSNHS